MSAPLFSGPVIITRYLGPTNHLGSRIIASHHRDSETVWRTVWNWRHRLDSTANHQAAAEALMRRWPFGTASDSFLLVGRGHDQNAYYWLAVGDWQLRHALERLQQEATPCA